MVALEGEDRQSLPSVGGPWGNFRVGGSGENPALRVVDCDVAGGREDRGESSSWSGGSGDTAGQTWSSVAVVQQLAMWLSLSEK